MKIHQIALATLLAVGPIAGALAQTTGPSIGANSQKDAGVRAGSDATSSTTPGATGKTVVPGSNSTVAGDRSGTAETKTGGVAGGAGGK